MPVVPTGKTTTKNLLFQAVQPGTPAAGWRVIVEEYEPEAYAQYYHAQSQWLAAEQDEHGLTDAVEPEPLEPLRVHVLGVYSPEQLQSAQQPLNALLDAMPQKLRRSDVEKLRAALPQPVITTRRPKDMTPEERAQYDRDKAARYYYRRKAGAPPKHKNRGGASRLPPSELLYGEAAATVNSATIVQQVVRFPLGVVQRLDNAAAALAERSEFDKTTIVTTAIEQYVTKLEKMYNRGKPFPIPPPGKGLRKYIEGVPVAAQDAVEEKE